MRDNTEVAKASSSSSSNGTHDAQAVDRVVEVKTRVTRIQKEPFIHDIIQLSTYCLLHGANDGDLVQCLPAEDNIKSSAAAADTHSDFLQIDWTNAFDRKDNRAYR